MSGVEGAEGRRPATSALPGTGAVGVGMRHRLARARAVVAANRAFVAVLAAFAAAAFIVPTLTPIATTDDWAYARSAEILYYERRLEVFPVVAATAVFPVFWNALFAVLFGPSLGVFRVATVVMTGLGGWALYGLCRQLGIGPHRAALGAAAYLFNPLAFSLAYTFMTDPYFTALLLVAACFYVRGLCSPAGPAWATVAGSAAAACALLTRQQGVLIPLAVATFLLVARRLSFSRAGLLLLLRVGALPAVATIGYALWLRFVNDLPAVQQTFLRRALATGWGGTWDLARWLAVVIVVYLGFFALPVVVAALPATRRLLTATPPAGRLLFEAWGALVVGGVAAAWASGKLMPYVGQFVGSGGIGPPDVRGSRPRLFEADARAWITIVCAAAAVLLGLVLFQRVGRPRAAGVGSPEADIPAAASGRARAGGAGAGLVLSLALWQVVGVLPPSYQYTNRGGSLDRYLLPLLPLALCLALWALRDVRLAPSGGWLVVAAFAAFSVAGTRDYLVFMDAIWTLAREATARGVPMDRLDAGSGWDGYHLYEYSRDNTITARTRNGPWWVSFYAPATDSAYVVATKPQRGYFRVTERPYSSWLERDPTPLYLLRHFAAPWPPAKPLPTPPYLPKSDNARPSGNAGGGD